MEIHWLYLLSYKNTHLKHAVSHLCNIYSNTYVKKASNSVVQWLCAASWSLITVTLWGLVTLCLYGAFQLYSKVRISEFPDGNFNWNIPWSRKVRRTTPAPTSKSEMAGPYINSVKVVVTSCLLAVLFYLDLIKWVIHTALSNFYLWTCCYTVFISKTQQNVFLSSGIANSG